jgi:hypothetical protein
MAKKGGAQESGPPAAHHSSALLSDPFRAFRTYRYRLVMSAHPLAACACLLLASCALTVEDRVSRVAKDWAQTIRASQVVPVYPLTEDLQPGDVFVVTRTGQREHEAYRERGFLPLDQLLTRLKGLDYQRFYEGGFLPGQKSGSSAPRVVFPTYAFEVERNEGARVAIPTKALPFALAFLQAERASGSVLIRDAFTYGIGADEVFAALRSWAVKPEVQNDLAVLANAHATPLYLRVVQRVYLANEVDVMLQRTDGRSAEAQATLPPFPTSAPSGDPMVRNLQESLATAIPGGAVTVVNASAYAVTLHEKFERPLAIGYLAVDVPLEADGTLGAPVATLDRLEGRAAEPAPRVGSLGNLQRELKWRRLEVQALPDASRRGRVVGRVAERLPAEAFGDFRNAGQVQEADAVVRDFFVRVDSWVKPVTVDGGTSYRTVIAHLDAALAEKEL